MRYFYLCGFILIIAACGAGPKIAFKPAPADAISGEEFFRKIATLPRLEREQIAFDEIMKGNVPAFLRRFVPVEVQVQSASGKTIKATYYVAPDYLAIGSAADFMRIPLTPNMAQKIADSLNCFLSTRKIADDIYKAAKVKLEPVPLYSYRDSAIMFCQHQLIIEGQRKGRKGLIAGIKKDVVISGKISRDPKPNRVAIYGWHLLTGKAIQPVYTGHVDWYVDYSHGIRLVYQKIKVDGKWFDYTEILASAELRGLICDEEFCDFYRYTY